MSRKVVLCTFPEHFLISVNKVSFLVPQGPLFTEKIKRLLLVFQKVALRSLGCQLHVRFTRDSFSASTTCLFSLGDQKPKSNHPCLKGLSTELLSWFQVFMGARHFKPIVYVNLCQQKNKSGVFVLWSHSGEQIVK